LFATLFSLNINALFASRLLLLQEDRMFFNLELTNSSDIFFVYKTSASVS